MEFKDRFLSQIINHRVFVEGGDLRIPLGKIVDVVVERPNEKFPFISGIIIDIGTERRYAPISDVLEISEIGEMRLAVAPGSTLPDEELALYIIKNLLDRAIEDIDKRVSVRIGDLEVVRDMAGGLRVVAADVGVIGLVRRMVGKKIPSPMLDRLPRVLISWDNIVVMGGKPLTIRLPEGESSVPQLHPSELAEIINALSSDEASHVMHALDDETAADALEYLGSARQQELITTMTSHRAADIIGEMQSSDAADLLGELPDQQRMTLLSHMEPEAAQELRDLVAHPDDTAGGMMSTEFVTVVGHITTVAALKSLRDTAYEKEFIYYLYVLDEAERLVGVVSLRALLVGLPTAFVEKLMNTQIISVRVDTPAADVAAIVAQYDLHAVPVLDTRGRMLGIVTVDDAIDAILPDGIAAKRTVYQRTQARVPDDPGHPSAQTISPL